MSVLTFVPFLSPFPRLTVLVLFFIMYSPTAMRGNKITVSLHIILKIHVYDWYIRGCHFFLLENLYLKSISALVLPCIWLLNVNSYYSFTFHKDGFLSNGCLIFIAAADCWAVSLFFSPHHYVSYILDRLWLLAAPGTCQTAEVNIAAAVCFQGAWLLEILGFEQVMERNGSCPDLIQIKRQKSKWNTRKQ